MWWTVEWTWVLVTMFPSLWTVIRFFTLQWVSQGIVVILKTLSTGLTWCTYDKQLSGRAGCPMKMPVDHSKVHRYLFFHVQTFISGISGLFWMVMVLTLEEENFIIFNLYSGRGIGARFNGQRVAGCSRVLPWVRLDKPSMVCALTV